MIVSNKGVLLRNTNNLGNYGIFKPLQRETNVKFSKVFLVPFNVRCGCRELSGPFEGNYMWKETKSKESVKIGSLFLYFMGREFDGGEITRIFRKV